MNVHSPGMPVIALAMGDPAGISPELTAKLTCLDEIRSRARLIVIGDKAEDAFRQAMLMSKGSLGIFFPNRLVTTLVLAGIALLLIPLVLQIVRLLRKPDEATDEKVRMI